MVLLGAKMFAMVMAKDETKDELLHADENTDNQ